MERVHLSLNPENYTEVELAYAAGIVDGEGYIAIVKQPRTNHGGYLLKVVVSNTDIKLMEWFILHFGGKLGEQEHRANPNWKVAYIWSLYGLEAANFLKLIQPFMLLKSPQVDLVLEFASLGYYNHSGIPEDVVYERMELANMVSMLNQKGRR